jgi:hypothetical protein
VEYSPQAVAIKQATRAILSLLKENSSTHDETLEQLYALGWTPAQARMLIEAFQGIFPSH